MVSCLSMSYCRVSIHFCAQCARFLRGNSNRFNAFNRMFGIGAQICSIATGDIPAKSKRMAADGDDGGFIMPYVVPEPIVLPPPHHSLLFSTALKSCSSVVRRRTCSVLGTCCVDASV